MWVRIPPSLLSSSMKIPKNHVEVSVDLLSYELSGPLDQVIAILKERAEGILEPQLVVECWDDYAEYVIKGYRPMTAEELEAAKVRRRKERERKAKAAADLEAQERETLAKLKAKYEQEGSP